MIDFLAPLATTEPLPKPAPVAVGPSYKNGISALNVARHFPVRLVRDGALAYRDIPSLMGGERVAHQATLADAIGGPKR